VYECERAGVDGGGITLPFRPDVDTAWLPGRYPAAVAGEFLATSSFLTGAALDGVGEATEPDILLALSS
jgi:hypothetical protein